MKDLKLSFGYSDDSTRLYNFSVEDSLASSVKGKILAINSSLSGGTDDGLSTFFVSNNGSPFTSIKGATLESSISEALIIAPNS